MRNITCKDESGHNRIQESKLKNLDLLLKKLKSKKIKEYVKEQKNIKEKGLVETRRGDIVKKPNQ